ncbi:acyltransferase [Endozoicomonas sp. 4G]|uniref:acyltransferase family protein n=1 Tax=Endozoicomonas sp. 4G TaxID=2872754 RepID=UPI002078BF04|nr:acyltransferase [Endozoicomonas sp. 4G]
MIDFRHLSKEESASLDFLRAISALLVVIGHGISFCGILTSLHQPNAPWMQNIAVVIFFILSGFLIAYSLAGKRNNNGYTYYHYVSDRFSRIYVTFIPALLFVVFIDFLSLTKSSDVYQYYAAYNPITFIANLLMLQDYPVFSFATSFGSARPFWTLAIEWWIYLFVGSLFFFFRDKKTKYIFLALIFMIVPLYNFIGGRGNGLFLYWLLGVGVFLVWSKGYVRSLSFNKKILAFVLFLILAVYRVLNTLVEYDKLFALFLSISILFFVEVASLLDLNKLILLISSKLANYSYTLYLIHYSLYDFLVSHYGGGVLIFFVGFLLSNTIAYIMGFYIEGKATRNIKDKLYFLIDKNISLGNRITTL